MQAHDPSLASLRSVSRLPYMHQPPILPLMGSVQLRTALSQGATFLSSYKAGPVLHLTLSLCDQNSTFLSPKQLDWTMLLCWSSSSLWQSPEVGIVPAVCTYELQLECTSCPLPDKVCFIHNCALNAVQAEGSTLGLLGLEEMLLDILINLLVEAGELVTSSAVPPSRSEPC